MKLRLAATALAICTAFLSASGQTTGKYIPDYTWEVRTGWGYAPISGLVLYAVSLLNHTSDDGSAEAGESGIATGDLSIDVAHKLNRWLAIGTDISWSRFSGNGNDGRRHIMDMYAVMPQVTMNYLTKENLTLYGKVEAGIGFIVFDCIGPSPFFAAQASPIGVSFGHKFYGFAELSAGTLYQGGKIGLGFRF